MDSPREAATREVRSAHYGGLHRSPGWAPAGMGTARKPLETPALGGSRATDQSSNPKLEDPDASSETVIAVSLELHIDSQNVRSSLLRRVSPRFRAPRRVPLALSYHTANRAMRPIRSQDRATQIPLD